MAKVVKVGKKREREALFSSGHLVSVSFQFPYFSQEFSSPFCCLCDSFDDDDDHMEGLPCFFIPFIIMMLREEEEFDEHETGVDEEVHLLQVWKLRLR